MELCKLLLKRLSKIKRSYYKRVNADLPQLLRKYYRLAKVSDQEDQARQGQFRVHHIVSWLPVL
jgi:hypothetical protein